MSSTTTTQTTAPKNVRTITAARALSAVYDAIASNLSSAALSLRALGYSEQDGGTGQALGDIERLAAVFDARGEAIHPRIRTSGTVSSPIQPIATDHAILPPPAVVTHSIGCPNGPATDVIPETEAPSVRMLGKEGADKRHAIEHAKHKRQASERGTVCAYCGSADRGKRRCKMCHAPIKDTLRGGTDTAPAAQPSTTTTKDAAKPIIQTAANKPVAQPAPAPVEPVKVSKPKFRLTGWTEKAIRVLLARDWTHEGKAAFCAQMKADTSLAALPNAQFTSLLRASAVIQGILPVPDAVPAPVVDPYAVPKTPIKPVVKPIVKTVPIVQTPAPVPVPAPQLSKASNPPVEPAVPHCDWHVYDRIHQCQDNGDLYRVIPAGKGMVEVIVKGRCWFVSSSIATAQAEVDSRLSRNDRPEWVGKPTTTPVVQSKTPKEEPEAQTPSPPPVAPVLKTAPAVQGEAKGDNIIPTGENGQYRREDFAKGPGPKGWHQVKRLIAEREKCDPDTLSGPIMPLIARLNAGIVAAATPAPKAGKPSGKAKDATASTQTTSKPAVAPVPTAPNAPRVSKRFRVFLALARFPGGATAREICGVTGDSTVGALLMGEVCGEGQRIITMLGEGKATVYALSASGRAAMEDGTVDSDKPASCQE